MRESLTWFLTFLVAAAFLTNRAFKPPATVPLKNYDEIEAKRYAHDGSQPTSWRAGNKPAEADRAVLALRSKLGFP